MEIFPPEHIPVSSRKRNFFFFTLKEFPQETNDYSRKNSLTILEKRSSF